MPKKKPFSGKQKKKQLQEKKHRGEGSLTRSGNKEAWKLQDQIEKYDSDCSSGDGNPHAFEPGRNIHGKATKSTNPRDRYRLNFLRESRDEIDKRKLQSQTELLIPIPPEKMEMSIEEVYQPGSELDMPQRPHWDYLDSKQLLEQREEKYFSTYLDNLYSKFKDKNLSYFEHNLETWRQLWRVIEMSDVIAMVADVRHPVLHFSPALYNFAIHVVKKPLILVLNKIDLVPAPVVIAWKKYFENKFPELHVITFTSFPKNLRGDAAEKRVSKKRAVGKRVYTTQIGPQELLQVCKKICGEKVNLESWEQKILNDLEGLNCDLEPEMNIEEEHQSSEQGPESKELFKNGRLTLGFVGHPNVGKSSLMNGLIGKKVVSTSVTPGHTKYFQTYFLTRDVMLCDCPGLVFPSLVQKQMQILSGIYPIAQVQEPYTPVGYLASRIPIVKLLGITHPNKESEWTAWDICEGWAEKRRFYTSKGRRTDVYRAANNILRMAVDGRLCLFMLPPGYVKEEKSWMANSETLKLLSLVSDPGSVGDILSFHQMFSHPEIASSEHDTQDSSSGEESESSHEHGDGGKGFSVQNQFALLGED
uniref:guanine nucleotide-binding protein-like 1 n=1 Tax=Styela clava TaxID=7725 RepID=UPI00193ABD4E|nr:guanine nucleotide-binding protein-like 1 [Styela clava]